MMRNASWIHALCAMFYVTGDRLYTVMASPNKYRNFWTIRKTWILVLITWLGYVIICIAGVLGTVYMRMLSFMNQAIMTYVGISLQCLYLVFAIITYSAIFVKYVRSSLKFNSSVQNILQRSKFSTAVMIIFTYVIFTNIPSIATAVAYIHYFMIKDKMERLTYAKNVMSTVWIYSTISARVSVTVDALIYVFLQDKVRKMFFNVFKCVRPETQAGAR